MPQFNALAIVLHRTHYGEIDNILTLYTRDRGKIDAIAKGARKAISRLSGATDPLMSCKFAIATGRGQLLIVTQAEVVDSFPLLRSGIERLAQAQYFAELLGAFTADGDPHPELYLLLQRGLRLLERAHDLEPIARWYELNLLRELGYAPDLLRCGICDCDLVDEAALAGGPIGALSLSQGHALCAEHAQLGSSPDETPLNLSTLHYLQQIEEAPQKASAVGAIRAPSEHSEDQARSALRRYIRYRLERELRSIAFLDSLR